MFYVLEKSSKLTTAHCVEYISLNIYHMFYKAKQNQSTLHLLTQAGYVAAIQLIWAGCITACALRVTSEYSFTYLGRMDS